MLEPTAIMDSGATGNFNQEDVGEPTGEMSRKIVGMANGRVERATERVLLPVPTLSQAAREGDELPSLKNSLISVPTMANNGYTTIFKPGNEGIKVYHSQDIQVTTKARAVPQG